MPPTIYSASISVSNPLPPFSINASTHNSLHAGRWAHAMNTWSCMSYHSGIVYAHMHNARLSLGVCLVPRSHPYEKDFETGETASDIDVASDSDCEQQAASSSQASANQLTAWIHGFALG
jgi:hypothetical protein